MNARKALGSEIRTHSSCTYRKKNIYTTYVSRVLAAIRDIDAEFFPIALWRVQTQHRHVLERNGDIIHFHFPHSVTRKAELIRLKPGMVDTIRKSCLRCRCGPVPP